MDNPKNLDDYLAGLGISEADESAPLLSGSAPPAAGGQAYQPPTAELSQGSEDEGGTGVAADGVAEPAADPQAALEAFLVGLAQRLDPELRVTVQQLNGGFEAELLGTSAARLAGRDGRVLAAIEVLCYAVLSRHGQHDLRVHLDAGGFRRRHAENLTRVAERLALQVAKTGEAHEMQPMPPADRRVVHLALQEHSLVQTESLGEGSGRRLIIRPRNEPPA